MNFGDPFGLSPHCDELGFCYDQGAVLGAAITGVFQTASAGIQMLGNVARAARSALLADKVSEIHGALDPIAQGRRTTAVLSTDMGDIAAGGARDLTPAQRATAARVGATTAASPGAHAEVTALEHARAMGARPDALAVSRPICPNCQQAIQQSGGTVTGPTTAVWRKGGG